MLRRGSLHYFALTCLNLLSLLRLQDYGHTALVPLRTMLVKVDTLKLPSRLRLLQYVKERTLPPVATDEFL